MKKSRFLSVMKEVKNFTKAVYQAWKFNKYLRQTEDYKIFTKQTIIAAKNIENLFFRSIEQNSDPWIRGKPTLNDAGDAIEKMNALSMKDNNLSRDIVVKTKIDNRLRSTANYNHRVLYRYSF